MKQLCQIENVRDHISSDGIATSDLLNSSGAVLVREGMEVHAGIYRMPVFQWKTTSDRISLHVEDSVADSGCSAEQDWGFLPVEREHVLQYYSLKKKLQSVFDTSVVSLSCYRTAVEIIDETFAKSREELIKALWLLRSADRYTCDHSLSVYLLFLEAIDDLRHHRMEDRFYSSLKSLSGKVNFDTSSLKRYAMGALMHDYGKMSIEEKIVHKDSALTLGELDLIRLHPYYGVRALKLIGVQDSEILDIVGNHHHNYRVDDMSQSPLAQICNIVDIYDACRAGRSYKDGFTVDRTMEILEEEFRISGWDPFIYEVISKETLHRMDERLKNLKTG